MGVSVRFVCDRCHGTAEYPISESYLGCCKDDDTGFFIDGSFWIPDEWRFRDKGSRVFCGDCLRAQVEAIDPESAEQIAALKAKVAVMKTQIDTYRNERYNLFVTWRRMADSGADKTEIAETEALRQP